MREKLEDPDTIVLRNSDAFPTEVSFDLDRLADYESVFEYLYESGDWEALWESELTRVQDLFIAQWLAWWWGPTPELYDDWVEEIDQLDRDPIDLRWSIDKEKFYKPTIRRLWPERDALDRGIEIVDGLIAETTGTYTAPAATSLPEPAPEPTPEPTPPAEAMPTLEPEESLAPNPFADL